MSDMAHDQRPVHSRLRRFALWLADKPETTAWIAVATAVMLAMEMGDHVLHWW